MANETDVIKKSEVFLNEIGMTPLDWLLTMGKYKATILQLSGANFQQFADLYEKLSKKDYQKSEKGHLLEELAYLLLYQGYHGLFECRKNIHTSSNEIDIQLCWSENARLAGLHQAFPFLGNSFLCECKNYNKKVDVTYVGKFFSLLKVADCKIGIMIAWDGISCRSKWADASGLIRKIALKDNTYILVIEKSDLARIYNHESNIFSIMHDKYIALQNDINYDTYIKPHEAEKKFKEQQVPDSINH